jgi:hypothetical protein
MDTFKKVDLPTIIVDECNLDTYHCTRCGLQIVLGCLRVSYIRNSHIDYMHLECFKPRNYVPILDNNVMISVTNPTEATRVTEWIASWNSQFKCHFSPHRSLEVTALYKNRVLLCVFGFLTVEELLAVALVNKKWYDVTWESELWLVLIERDFKVEVVTADRRTEYIKLYTTVCMNCYRETTDQDFCPILRRPLCQPCRTVSDPFKDKYGLLSKQQLTQVFGVDSNWLKQRKLKWTYSKQNHKLTYQYLFIEALYDLRRWKQDLVIEFLVNREFCRPLIEWTRQLDIKELHTLESDSLGSYTAQTTFKPLDVNWSAKAQVIHEFLRVPSKGKTSLNDLGKALNLSLPSKRRRG